MEYASLILLHVFFGILWAGGAVTIGLFVIPSVFEAGPGAGPVMGGILKRRFPTLMTVSGVLVVLSGLRLYSMQFSAAWVATPRGITLTLGGLAGLAAFVIGVFMQRPLAMRLGALGAQLAAAGAAPTPEQAAEMASLRTRLAKVARVNAWHLIAAALLMAAHSLAAMVG